MFNFLNFFLDIVFYCLYNIFNIINGGDSMTLGELITNYRTKHGLSQRKFAEKCNISNGYISMIEKGEHPKTKQPITPTLDKLKSLAHGMGMSLQQLCMFVDYIDASLENDYPQAFSTIAKENFPLSNHEKKVVTAYREKPEMQSAVDTLLGVKQEDSEMRTIYRAARSADHHEPTIEKRNIHDIERLENAPSVTSDDDL